MKKFILTLTTVIFLAVSLSGCFPANIKFDKMKEDIDTFKDIGEDISNAFKEIEQGITSSDKPGDKSSEENEQDGISVDSVIWSALKGQRLANFGSDNYDGGDKFPRGSYEGQCTWYCFGRVLEKLGKTITFSGSGMAGEWLTSVDNCETSDDIDAIRSDCIAVSDIHVVYIEFVQSGTVYYTEANWPRDDKLDETDGLLKTESTENFIRDRNITGYVYLTD